MVKQTTALRKIRAMRKRIRVIQGGQGAAKTWAIITTLINYALSRERLTITVFQFELSKAKPTVVRDFKNIMQALGIWERERWYGGVMYTFSNGSYIEFAGLDTVDLGKGFRRDIVYFNEANRGILYEAFQQVESRSKIVYIDFNPDSDFWVHREVLPGADAEFIILTFRDNEYLSEIERANILAYKAKGYHDPELPDYDKGKSNVKNEYWANRWRVYGMGLTGIGQGQVFIWQQADEMPGEYDWQVYGLDFGFTNDPTALVRVRKVGQALYFQTVFYEPGLGNREITRRAVLAGLTPNDLIYADSADPKSIADLRQGFKDERLPGLCVVGAMKGPDSIKAGINKLNEYDCHYIAGDAHLSHELSNYKYIEVDGKLTNQPVDKFNHAIDAARYAAFTHTMRAR